MISHLLLADDTVIRCGNDLEEIGYLEFCSVLKLSLG